MKPGMGSKLVVNDDVTRLLNSLNDNEGAAEELFQIIYDELHNSAHNLMRAQRPGHTLQASALVNEAFLKLAGNSREWNSRRHFLAMAVRAMRTILVDHARGRLRQKRQSQGSRVALERIVVAYEQSVPLLELEEALEQLTARDPDLAQIVELRFFGGLSMPEIAEFLQQPLRTVERSWEFARTWLKKKLS